MKNTQQTIGIDDELLDISSFPRSLLILSPVGPLICPACPPPSYDTNLKYHALHYSFYAQLFPNYFPLFCNNSRILIGFKISKIISLRPTQNYGKNKMHSNTSFKINVNVFSFQEICLDHLKFAL